MALNWIDQTLRDGRYGMRSLLKSPGFSALAVAVARHRRHGDDGDLQRAPCGRARSVPLQGRRSSDERPRVGRDAARLSHLLLGRSVPRDRRAEHDLRRRDRVHDQRRRCGPATAIRSAFAAITGRSTRSTSWACRRSWAGHRHADDARPGAEPVVVLGYRFWQRQFGGDPDVLGRQLRLNDTVRTVIGVMPKRFMWRGADVYLPVDVRSRSAVEGVRTVHLLGRAEAGRHRRAG